MVKLGKIERVDVRLAWLNEAHHFTPWLASEQGMELLQDALDMDLEVEATEQFIGPFKCDLVAKRADTTDEHWVLVENQIEKTDHRHLGQLLTYAAGLKAATIVWMAERFEEEHRAALDWLNEITSEDFAFYGLEIELWQIGESPPAPMFNVIVQPNDWSREIKQSADASLTDLKQLQLRYWQTLRAKLLETKSKVRPQKAHPQHWADFALGRAGTWLTAAVNSPKKIISVEFAFRGPPGKAWFQELEAQKDLIEQEFGQPLSWQRLDNRKQSRIALYREQTDPSNEADWPVQHQWMQEMLERFRTVFKQRASELSGGPGGYGDSNDGGNLEEEGLELP
jgi:hypothetical protein